MFPCLDWSQQNQQCGHLTSALNLEKNLEEKVPPLLKKDLVLTVASYQSNTTSTLQNKVVHKIPLHLKLLNHKIQV